MFFLVNKPIKFVVLYNEKKNIIMELIISDIPFGSRPNVTRPHPRFLEELTEKGIRKLISDHYDLLVKSTIQDLFPKDEEGLNRAKERAADFFIQICGGYPFFNEKHGSPMLVKRHASFSITEDGRKVWLDCYRQILPKLNIDKELILSFWEYLNVFSIWMVNTSKINFNNMNKIVEK